MRLGDAFPHDVLLDENGGVGFRKGCYIGQEVVSRMQHRGTARRRVLIALRRRPCRRPARRYSQTDAPVGTLGTVVAAIRGWRSRASTGSRTRSMPASRSPPAACRVTLGIPPCAKFSFPQETAGAEEA